MIAYEVCNCFVELYDVMVVCRNPAHGQFRQRSRRNMNLSDKLGCERGGKLSNNLPALFNKGDLNMEITINISA